MFSNSKAFFSKKIKKWIVTHKLKASQSSEHEIQSMSQWILENVNVEYVDNLISCFDSEIQGQFYKKLLTVFVNEFDRDLARLSEIQESGSYKDFIQVIHKVKGAALNMGFKKIFDLSSRMESYTQADFEQNAKSDLNQVQELLSDLKSRSEELVESFTQ